MVKEDKRRQKRVLLQNASITLSMGNRILNNCDLRNVSFGGLRAVIPTRFLPKDNEIHNAVFTAIISYKSRSIKLRLEPCWYKDSDGIYGDIGFQITDDNPQWKDLLRKHTILRLPPLKDVWGREGQKFMSR